MGSWNHCGRVHSTAADALKCCSTMHYDRGVLRREVVELDRSTIESDYPNWVTSRRWQSLDNDTYSHLRWDFTNEHRGAYVCNVPDSAIRKLRDRCREILSEGSTERKESLAKARIEFCNHELWRRGFADEQFAPAAKPAPEPAPAAAPAPAKPDRVAEAFDILSSVFGSKGSVDPEAVRAIAEDAANEAVAKAASSGTLSYRVVVERPDASEWTPPSGAVHKQFEDAMQWVSVGEPVLLKGPAGTGKSMLASQLAEALGRPFGQMALTGGTTEAHFVGRNLPDSSGEFRFRTTPFLDAFENGGVMLLDEVDACDENVLLAINNGIANGTLPVPGREDAPYAKKHDDFVLVAAANTWGTGPSAMYVGRNQLDEAFLDRFAKVEVDYDRDLEASLCADGAMDLAQAWWKLRDAVQDAQLRRVVSMRSLLRYRKMMLTHKWTAEACRMHFLASWTKDERTAVGVK